MNYHECLEMLMTVNARQDLNSQLQEILKKVLPQLSTFSNISIHNTTIEPLLESDIRLQYLSNIVHVLMKIGEESTKDDTEILFSVNQFRTIKRAIQLVTAIGIIPSLIPMLSVHLIKLLPQSEHYCKDEITDIEKYRRLTFSATSLAELYKCSTFRPAIVGQLQFLLAALLQLHHAPLMKPLTNNKGQFQMSPDLYNELREDQVKFGTTLKWLLENCPMTEIIKGLMVIHGLKGSPSWLRRIVRNYLVHKIMEPNGVVSTIASLCDDSLDFGEHWEKLDVTARLLATSHGQDPEIYYNSVCPQILDLLKSKQVKHAATIANNCIAALYEHNMDICIRNIIDVILAPLIVITYNSGKICHSKSEDEVTACIENLVKCFLSTEAQFKRLPSNLLLKVAVPLFTLYNNVRQSPWFLRSKLRLLLLRLLSETNEKHHLFSHFLGFELSNKYGYYMISKFGPSGGIEIVEANGIPRYEEFTDTLLDLIIGDSKLMNNLFMYLLEFLSTMLKPKEETAGNLLQHPDDTIQRVEQQLLAMQLLSKLANSSIVQREQLENPERLLSFIQSLFNNYITMKREFQIDDEIVYVSLMLVKMILNERKPSDWKLFDDFSKFLQKFSNNTGLSKQLLLLVRDIINIIKTRARSEKQHFQDLSADSVSFSKFEAALKDLADPLLPVRAHGIITLTRLIENNDPCVDSRKAILLRLFEENLKHEDSFIYLTTINGYCALATVYPDVVLQTLVQEFIDMPNRISTGDITSETRMKLGEVIVKTTKMLGEMVVVHKNMLINGFLCAVKDPDPLVRASSLSCLGELCRILGFRLGGIVTEVIYCISCIIKTDQAPECRRAAVLVATLLIRGLGHDTLSSLTEDLIDLYRGLKFLRDNDADPVLCLHAQLALEELDLIVRDFLFALPKLEKKIIIP